MSHESIAACEWRVGPRTEFGSGEVHIVERRQRDGEVRYAVRRDEFVANRAREWEYEPIPSSRDDDFIARTRWDDWQDAAAVAVAMVGVK
jgi:hypothetical protein